MYLVIVSCGKGLKAPASYRGHAAQSPYHLLSVHVVMVDPDKLNYTRSLFSYRLRLEEKLALFSQDYASIFRLQLS